MAALIRARPLDAAAFEPFGEVLDFTGAPDRLINRGQCGRYHDRATLDFGADGRAGVSLFEAQPVDLPHRLEMVERHPDGSQTFVPMTAHPFLVVVAADGESGPATPLAFVTVAGQAVSYRRGVWHGVLTPLHAPGRFAVIDRIGPTPNLEEHWFDPPYEIVLDDTPAAVRGP